MFFWFFYLAMSIMIFISQWLSWYGFDSLIFYLIHTVLGGVVIFVALYKMVPPVWRLISKYSGMGGWRPGLDDFVEQQRQHVEEGDAIFEKIKKIRMDLEKEESSLTNDRVIPDGKSRKDALKNIIQLEEKAKKMLEVEKDSIDKFNKHVLENEEFMTTNRRLLQLEMLDNFWPEINGFVFLNIGFGAIYYGIWGIFEQIGVKGFDVSPHLSVTLSDFLYYSIVTVTTLGYGDISPILWLTQVLVVLQVVLGIGFFVGILGGLISLLNSEELFQTKMMRQSRYKELNDFIVEWVEMITDRTKSSLDFFSELKGLFQKSIELRQGVRS